MTVKIKIIRPRIPVVGSIVHVIFLLHFHAKFIILLSNLFKCNELHNGFYL